MLTQTSNLREGTYKKSSLALKHSWPAVKWSRGGNNNTNHKPLARQGAPVALRPLIFSALAITVTARGDVWAYFLGEPPSSRMMQQDRERKRGELHSRPSLAPARQTVDAPTAPVQPAEVLSLRTEDDWGSCHVQARAQQGDLHVQPGPPYLLWKKPGNLRSFNSPRFRNKQESNYSLKIYITYLSELSNI